MIARKNPHARPPWLALAASAMIVGLWPGADTQAQGQPRTPPDTAMASIYGIVTDARTGKPVPGVQVVLVGTRIGGLTNQDGRYVIVRAPTASHAIEFQRTCFRTVQVDVSSSLSPGGRLRVDIGLPFQRPESRPGVIVPAWACQEFGGHEGGTAAPADTSRGAQP